MLSLPGLLLALGLCLGLVWAVLNSLQGGGRCRSCGRDLETIGQVRVPAVPGYEVLGCRACGTGHTAVHGRVTPRVYCPSCRQRTLQTGVRLRHGGQAEVTEHCPVCDYRASRHLGGGPPGGRGKVVRFPGS